MLEVSGDLIASMSDTEVCVPVFFFFPPLCGSFSPRINKKGKHWYSSKIFVNLYPLSNHYPFFPSVTPTITSLFSISIDLPIVDTSYSWNYIIQGLLCLASSTKHNDFKIYMLYNKQSVSYPCSGYYSAIIRNETYFCFIDFGFLLLGI